MFTVSRSRLLAAVLAAVSMAIPTARARALPAQKDYLSEAEADKIRNAESISQKIKLYLSFASDRLKKFQYELSGATPENDRSEILNGLLNGYSGSLDDAADMITEAREKQEDIRGALKEMQSKTKEFLASLDKISKEGAELQTYKDTLDDAIEGTRDALKDAEKGLSGAGQPPVRRKP